VTSNAPLVSGPDSTAQKRAKPAVDICPSSIGTVEIKDGFVQFLSTSHPVARGSPHPR
jgi:hypothetical protein